MIRMKTNEITVPDDMEVNQDYLDEEQSANLGYEADYTSAPSNNTPVMADRLVDDYEINNVYGMDGDAFAAEFGSKAFNAIEKKVEAMKPVKPYQAYSHIHSDELQTRIDDHLPSLIARNEGFTKFGTRLKNQQTGGGPTPPSQRFTILKGKYDDIWLDKDHRESCHYLWELVYQTMNKEINKGHRPVCGLNYTSNSGFCLEDEFRFTTSSDLKYKMLRESVFPDNKINYAILDAAKPIFCTVRGSLDSVGKERIGALHDDLSDSSIKYYRTYHPNNQLSARVRIPNGVALDANVPGMVAGQYIKMGVEGLTGGAGEFFNMDLEFIKKKVIGKHVVCADLKNNDQMYWINNLFRWFDYFLEPQLAKAYKEWYMKVGFVGAYTNMRTTNPTDFETVFYHVTRDEPYDFASMLSGLWATSIGGKLAQNAPRQLQHISQVLGCKIDEVFGYIEREEIIAFNNNDDRVDGGSAEYCRELSKVITSDPSMSIGLEDPGYSGDVYITEGEDNKVVDVVPNPVSLFINSTYFERRDITHPIRSLEYVGLKSRIDLFYERYTYDPIVAGEYIDTLLDILKIDYDELTVRAENEMKDAIEASEPRDMLINRLIEKLRDAGHTVKTAQDLAWKFSHEEMKAADPIAYQALFVHVAQPIVDDFHQFIASQPGVDFDVVDDYPTF